MNFGSLAAVALLTAWAGMASAQTKEHVFKIGSGLSEDHPQAQSLKHFAEQLAAKSGGKLSARVYASGALGAHTEQLVDGATLDLALKHRRIAERTPRRNH